MTTNITTSGSWFPRASSLALLACSGILACSTTPTGTTPSNVGTAGVGFVSPGFGGSVAPGVSGSAAPIGTAGISGLPAFGGSPALGAAGTVAAPLGGRSGAVAGAGAGGMIASVGGTGAGGTGVSTGGTGAVAGTGGPVTPAAEIMGCGTTKLLKAPDDPSALGPWPVGARTVQIPVGGVMMTTEVWYPAKPGSQAGMTETSYDLRQFLGSNSSVVPDSDNKLMPCKNCFRDLPIDAEHGPYPVIIFVHGLLSIRVANLTANTLWASRGFIVLAADHPQLGLTDGAMCPGAKGGTLDIPGNVSAEIKAVSDATGAFAFLGKSADVTRIGLSGHSTGAGGIAGLGNVVGVQVIAPLAPLTPPSPSGAGLKSVLFTTGLADSITTFSASQTAYLGSSAPLKRLVGITGGDHMDVTDLCWQKNDKGKNSLEVGLQYNACPGIGTVVLLFKCGTVDGPMSTKVVNYTTTAAFEETLQCQDRKKQFADLKTTFNVVGQFDHQP